MASEERKLYTTVLGYPNTKEKPVILLSVGFVKLTFTRAEAAQHVLDVLEAMRMVGSMLNESPLPLEIGLAQVLEKQRPSKKKNARDEKKRGKRGAFGEESGGEHE